MAAAVVRRGAQSGVGTHSEAAGGREGGAGEGEGWPATLASRQLESRNRDYG